MRVPVQARTLEQLREITTPAPVIGGNMEVFRDPLYDTQTYVAAGSALLNFFVNPNADLSLSNLEQGGTVPDPEYFQLWYVRVVPLLTDSEAAAPTAWRDMLNIMQQGRPILTLSVMSKPYGPWHVFNMGAKGPDLVGYSDGAGAGVVSHEAGAGGPDSNGGFCLDGAIWLLPKASFRCSIRWGNPLAVAADTLIRVELDAVHYRAIR